MAVTPGISLITYYYQLGVFVLRTYASLRRDRQPELDSKQGGKRTEDVR
jgi:hypothetical protein